MKYHSQNDAHIIAYVDSSGHTLGWDYSGSSVLVSCVQQVAGNWTQAGLSGMGLATGGALGTQRLLCTNGPSSSVLAWTSSLAHSKARYSGTGRDF